MEVGFRREQAFVFVVLLAAVLALQGIGGGYSSALSGTDDEAAHYVTGLLFRDYIAAGFQTTPIEYAENYYLHYPKVGIGHWPPVFYALEAVWTLPFGASRTSVLLLMAVIGAALAWSLYRFLRDAGLPAYAAGAGGIVLLLVPLVAEYSRLVMTELFVALLVWHAALAFSRFLENISWRNAAAYGVFTTLAVMTNGKGLVAILIAPLAIGFTRRFDVLLKRSFWIAPAIVAVCCGPWYLYTTNRYAHSRPPALDYAHMSLIGHPMLLAEALGPVLTVLALSGLVLLVREGLPGRWAALIAIPAAVLIFHAVVDVGIEARYVMTAVPVMVGLAVWGAWRLSALSPHTATVFLALFVLAVSLNWPRGAKRERGHVEVARGILSRPEWRDSVILVSGGAASEGALIAEIAMHEQRPGHYVLRATKLLGQSSWIGTRYRRRYRSTEELRSLVEDLPVGLVVMDSGDLPAAHHGELRALLVSRPHVWQRLEFGNHPIEVYRHIGHEGKRRGRIEIELDMIRRKITG